MKILQLLVLVLVTSTSQQAQQSIRFAVIGDYGSAGTLEADVAKLVKSWKPDFVITTGDNNYPNGSDSTIDQNIGQYYHEFISPYVGRFGKGDTVNRFFPSLGNHDWRTPGVLPYLNYFTLPGNERYYDFVRGPVHFFAIDSDVHEPDSIGASSVQALWLKKQLSASLSPWKIVYFHHPPYSSGDHGNSTKLQWPFKEWGASAIITGHDHTYERLTVDSLLYFVNGSGGNKLYEWGTIVPGSSVRYNQDVGAMDVRATDAMIEFRFVTRNDSLVDRYTIRR